MSALTDVLHSRPQLVEQLPSASADTAVQAGPQTAHETPVHESGRLGPVVTAADEGATDWLKSHLAHDVTEGKSFLGQDFVANAPPGPAFGQSSDPTAGLADDAHGIQEFIRALKAEATLEQYGLSLPVDYVPGTSSDPHPVSHEPIHFVLDASAYESWGDPWHNF